MQQQNGTKANATSNTQSNAKETDKESYLTEAKQIPGSPFMIRRVEEKWFITCGEMRFTEPTKTEEEQYEKLETEKWAITAKLVIHLNKLDRLAEATKTVDQEEEEDTYTHDKQALRNTL